MNYRKFKGERLFTGLEMVDGTHVVITDATGLIVDIVDEADAGDNIETHKGIISPGFINCHCHLELSHMKGLIPERTGLIDFVFKVVTQRHFSEREIVSSIALGEEEMIKNGIVAVGDICNNNLTLQQKAKGNLDYYNFIEASGWLPGVAMERFSRSLSFYKQFAEKLPLNSIVPHAPYSVSNALWRQITPYFSDKTASIHNQETEFEDAFFMNGTGDFIRMYQMMKIDNSHFVPGGKSSVQSYFQKLSPAKNLILVHNTFTQKVDIAFANQAAQTNQQSLWWCLCPNANRYIEDRLPPVTDLVAEKSNIVIGTDSLASNKQLSVLSELKTLHEHFKNVEINELLKWATINGARALSFEDKLGSFEKGKQPGALVINDELTEVKRLV